MIDACAENRLDVALALHRAGRVAEADAIYTDIIRREPDNVRALRLLGAARQQRGDHTHAVMYLERALSLQPNDSVVWSNISVSYRDLKLTDKAIIAAQNALKLDKSNGLAYSNLAIALISSGRQAEAIPLLRQAVQLAPNVVEPWINLGAALHETGELEEATKMLRRAAELAPDRTEVWCNLGNALRDSGALDEAMAAYSRAIAISPNNHHAWNNRGMAQDYLCDRAGALASFRRASQLDPSASDPHVNAGIILLRNGDFENGWAEYEHRLKAPAFPLTPLPQPAWDGRPLEGKTILVREDQGYGDAIQFCRFLPLLSARGAGRIIIECREALARLLACMPGVETVVPGQPLPAFDVHCAMMSLGKLFDVRADAIPGWIPYLFPRAEWVFQWGRRFSAYPSKLKVGLAWAGRPTHRRDRQRSIDIARLAPLAAIENAVFFSLQKGSAALQPTPAGLPVIDLSDAMTDLAETAACISHLDLVITVDTAVAHLAAAMGKPTWVMLPNVADWRWQVDRSDSPWYPSMRLFRQTAAGDWERVIEAIANAARDFRAPRDVPAMASAG